MRFKTDMAAIVLSRSVAFVCVALLLAIVVDYPLGGHWLAAMALTYALLLARWPWLWLIIVPVALGGLDLSPWSGSFLADEFDALILVTLAVHYGRFRPTRHGGVEWHLASIAVLVLAISYGASLAVALWGRPAVNLNSFSTYWSPYYGLRVAKGFVWAVGLAPLIAAEFRDAHRASRRLALGVQLGLLAACLWIVMERLVFAGLLGFSNDFRVTGPFFTMHVGGQHVDAFLALALPFAFVPLSGCRRPWLSAAWTCLLLTLGIYAVMATMSRGVIVAAPLAVLLVAVDRLRRVRLFQLRRGRCLVWTVGLVPVVVVILLPLLQSRFLHERFSRWRDDLNARWNHWSHALAIMPAESVHAILGAGLGSFPRIASGNPDGPEGTGQYEYLEEGGNRYLRFHSGGPNIYFGQHVPVQPFQTYRLLVRLRSPHRDAGVCFTIYEKNLLYSFRGVTVREGIRMNNAEWECHDLLLDSGEAGLPSRRGLRRPVRFGMFRSVADGWIDIDNVQLLDANGNDLLRNGDFSATNDRWFFTCDHHTIWRIFSLWVRLYFEQGMLGVAAFTLYLAMVLVALVRHWRLGHPLAPVWAAAVLGFLLVGLFGSLLDAPRIALLFYLLTIAILTSSGPTSLQPVDSAMPICNA